MNSYHRFSQYYDLLTDNIDYQKHADYYEGIVAEYTDEKGILLDLACGTGSLCEAMAKKGFDVIGVDLSDEMLSIALDKKFESGLPIQYLCQDMCELDMYGTIDVTICALDSLNHLSSFAQIKCAVERVSLFSNPGALFIFDVNTIYKHKNVLGNNTFIYDTEDIFCAWQNTFDEEDSSVIIDLTFFEKIQNTFNRFDESFTEKAYHIRDLLSLCENSGFEIKGVYDYMTYNPLRDNSEKVTVIARKVR